jgi:hypothetical protein
MQERQGRKDLDPRRQGGVEYTMQQSFQVK